MSNYVECTDSANLFTSYLVQSTFLLPSIRVNSADFSLYIGSGKTLAYLAPLIHRLREEEERHGVIPRLKRPRALILLPSRDLAAQVLLVAKSLCHVARFRAVGLIGGIKRVSI